MNKLSSFLLIIFFSSCSQIVLNYSHHPSECGGQNNSFIEEKNLSSSIESEIQLNSDKEYKEHIGGKIYREVVRSVLVKKESFLFATQPTAINLSPLEIVREKTGLERICILKVKRERSNSFWTLLSLGLYQEENFEISYLSY